MMLTDSKSQSWLIIISTLFLMLFTNVAFFKGVVGVYPFVLENVAFLISVFILFYCLTAIIISLFCYRYTIKPVLITILLISSFTAYFMDSYSSIIDETMIENILQTNMHEAIDLFSIKQVLYVLFLGVLPALFVYKTTITKTSFLRATISKLKLIGVLTMISVAILWLFSDYYFSFFREHRSLRYYINPVYYMMSIGKYATHSYRHPKLPLQKIATDAETPSGDDDRELIIFIVGETARADHFSLNGYKKKTNPLLEKQNIINFSNVSSCGTSTAHSVPCMFSIYTHDNYDKNKIKNTENILDILQKVGVNVLWLDNNSSSKGVADRVPYQDFRTAENNPLCDIECRDEGMLVNLQDYIDSHPTGDIFIVLHQMGNHGPAYYKRYPKAFEKFTPTCKTNQFESCSKQQISNSYDNAIIYTDYFLSKVIELLKNNSNKFESAMFYASDHGESLGENGLYLHGLPYMMAPDAQKKVPFILWFSESFDDNDIDMPLLKSKVNSPLSHDNIFHTLLGLFEVNTRVYERNLDLTEYKNSPHNQ